MSGSTSTAAKQIPQYDLLYHPGIPGRGEFIRLAFEAAGVPYTDIANDSKDGYTIVQGICMNPDTLESSPGNPPLFSPPALRIRGDGDSPELIIHQTSVILDYLAPRLGLTPEDEVGRLRVQQLALTAFDLTNEIHDTHHPIAVGQYYEDQKVEALAKATYVRENRLPKFLSYFLRTLLYNQQHHGGKGRFLVAAKLTYADLVLWQLVDGLFYAFPREMEARRETFGELLGEDGFYGILKRMEEGVRAYLGSERRMKYSMGIFRYYPELDRQV